MALVVVVITTGVLFFAHSFRELRLDQPEQYEELLRGRELMLNLPVHHRPVVFPSVVATIAFLSSADPMDVTRFLTPVLEFIMVFATGLVIRMHAWHCRRDRGCLLFGSGRLPIRGR